MSYEDRVHFADLMGVTLMRIDREGDERLTFHAVDRSWVMCHLQDCCEGVEIAEIIGDLDDLVGAPILLAEEVTGGQNECPEGVSPPECLESYTWTFYKLATVKGHVTIRWLGESNGYYSESVDFERVAA